MLRRRMAWPELLTRFPRRGRAGARASMAQAADGEGFGVDVRRDAGVATVRPRGDLDLVSAATLQAVLDDIHSARRIVLDLRRVSFMDSAGVHLLVELDGRARRERFELSIVPPSPPADLSIELCGLYDLLPFAPAGA